MSVIKVDNLSKKYIISHQQHERYTALRDVMAIGVKRMFNRGIVQPFKCLTSNSRVQQFPSSTTEEFFALKDVSFEVKQGDRVGIIGRNGAGKSTLLKILSRITEPTKGRVEITGRVASLLEVGTGFHPELTGRENIFLNGAILGMSKWEIKKKFDEIVAFAEIEKFLDTPVKRYSSGMYVRLAFAVAAHLEPEILIVDEVLAVGDAQFQKKCLGKMNDIGKEGRTILFVSHNMGAIRRLCPRVIWLDKGCVRDIGPVERVTDQYLSSGFEYRLAAVIFSDVSDKVVRFLRAEMFDSSGQLISVFNADKPIRIRITYEIAKPLSGTSLGINILSAMGEPLWSMADWEVYPELFEHRDPGVWTGDWIVPSHILRPGSYFVALGAGDGTNFYHHPEPFPFEISLEGTWRSAYKFFGLSGGPICAKMEITRPIMLSKEDSGV
jgi:lipopolysaccharide transport system ATP-binding protein